MKALYLASLVVPLVCMALVDHRWRLFLFRRPRAALLLTAAGAVVFLVWDLIAISTRMYHRGASPAMTGLDLAPDLPVEELVFIVFLCYLTMVLHQLARRVLAARLDRTSADA